MLKKYIIICLIWIPLLWACSPEGDPGGTVVVDIDSDFTVFLLERLQPENPQVYRRLKSDAAIACNASALDYTLEQREKEIVIHIKGILKPTDCDYSKSDILIEDIDLPIDQVGDYGLTIDFLKYFQNRGKLVVSDDSYHLTIEQDKGLNQAYTTLYKTPKNLIWAYLNDFDVRRGPQLVTQFYQMIEEISAPPDTLSIGRYSVFSIGENGALRIYGITNSPHNLQFYFERTGNISRLKEKVFDFRSLLPTGVELHLFTAQGDTL